MQDKKKSNSYDNIFLKNENEINYYSEKEDLNTIDYITLEDDVKNLKKALLINYEVIKFFLFHI